VKASWNLLNLVNARNIRATAKAQYDVAREPSAWLPILRYSASACGWIDFNSRRQQFRLVQKLSRLKIGCSSTRVTRLPPTEEQTC